MVDFHIPHSFSRPDSFSARCHILRTGLCAECNSPFIEVHGTVVRRGTWQATQVCRDCGHVGDSTCSRCYQQNTKATLRSYMKNYEFIITGYDNH